MKIIEQFGFASLVFLVIALAGQLFIRCSNIHDEGGPDIITPENALDSYLSTSDTA